MKHQPGVWEACGLRLQTRCWGAAAGSAPVWILLHGFAGSAAAWEPVAKHLPLNRCYIGVDLPGHGGSAWPKPGLTLQDVAKALAVMLQTLAVGPVTLIGYSLGGRLALQLALGYPEGVGHLMLVSASPGVAGATERDERRERDGRWAALLQEEGMAGFIAQWDEQALFNGGRSLDGAQRAWWRELRLAQDPEGLAQAIAAFSPGREPYVGPALSQCLLPTELVVGANDARYVIWGETMRDSMRASRLHVLDGVAHNVPLEAPNELAQVMLRSLI